MEPISALGVAAACVQFIDFGLGAIALCKQIRDSDDGLTEYNAELVRQIKVIRGVNDSLKLESINNTHRSKRIAEQARSCSITADDLLQVLEETRKAGNAKSFKTARLLFRTLRERKTIEKLENRLKKRHECLQYALAPEMWHRIQEMLVDTELRFSKQNLETRQQFQSLHKQQASDHTKLLHGQENIQTEIKSLSAQLDSVMVELRLPGPEADNLRRFFFPEIEGRPAVIQVAWLTTLARMFDTISRSNRQWANFSQWLETGESTYWISGQGGTGKSTLMAYILENPKTVGLLKTWSRQKQLKVISFYFYRTGSSAQRDIQGLLRSLLYQICKDHSALLRFIMGELRTSQKNINEWTARQHLDGLEKALSCLSEHRFCVFIDGLDEFCGNQEDLLHLLEGLKGHKHVKICVSSRPETFLESHLASGALLRIQDIDAKDISAPATDRVQEIS